MTHAKEPTHFFVHEAVQDGHQETLWRHPAMSDIMNFLTKLTIHFYDAFSVAVMTKPQNMCQAESFRDLL